MSFGPPCALSGREVLRHPRRLFHELRLRLWPSPFRSADLLTTCHHRPARSRVALCHVTIEIDRRSGPEFAPPRRLLGVLDNFDIRSGRVHHRAGVSWSCGRSPSGLLAVCSVRGPGGRWATPGRRWGRVWSVWGPDTVGAPHWTAPPDAPVTARPWWCLLLLSRNAI